MDVFEALRARRSIRSYQDKPVPVEILEEIADAGRFAATARNVQPWEFILITKKDTLKKLAELAENGRFLAGAGACIAVYCSETKYYLEDGCAATENMLIAAAGLGIGSCWVAGDKKPYCEAVSRLLNAPQAFKLVSLVSLGYPDAKDTLSPVEKRGLKELLHREKF